MTGKSAATRRIAYFSMEIGLDPRVPTYSGGLGILAGDTLRAAADLGLPMCAVTLLYRKGYFQQKIDASGRQVEEPVAWRPEEQLQKLDATVEVQVAGRTVRVGAWRLDVVGERGDVVPVYFLDTTDPANSAEDQALSDTLYGGDNTYRLAQEIVLGIGGVRMLKALGHAPAVSRDECAGIHTYHMNEGHSALLTLALLEERVSNPREARESDLAWVRERTVFTTHTPVPAGHDTFPLTLVESLLGKDVAEALEGFEVCPNATLNMSLLALRLSRYVNGVAKRHGEVSRRMFPGHQVQAITNGVHALSWTADAMRELFDRHVPGWREDNDYLRYACEIPFGDLKEARFKAKAALLQAVAERTGVRLDPHVFTIGFARRAAEYKRADLLFENVEKLKEIASAGPVQIIYAGKAHPRDEGGKAVIQRVIQRARQLEGSNIQVVYLENYDMTLGRLICSGVDLWLNNPVKPLEASGTSGMKAAINGVPSLSTLDGWWVEGWFEGVTGWVIDDEADAFGAAADDGRHRADTANGMYQKLKEAIVPLYYRSPDAWATLQRNAIAINGPFFNTHRMVRQYEMLAYR